MNSAATPTKTVRADAGGFSAFRLIPRLEKFPSVVSFVQTPLGRITLLMLFGAELRFFIESWNSVTSLSFILGLMTFMPNNRRFILAIAPIVYLIGPHSHELLLLGLTLVVIAIGICLYWCAMRWPKSRFGQRPIVFLLTGFTLLIISACESRPASLTYSVLWTSVSAVSGYVWFIAYALTDRNSRPGNDLTLELGAFRPLWGSATTPFPKGAAYLRRIEARNPEQLAIAQLKGLKLLTWAIMLAAFSHLWDNVFHVYLRIPTSGQALTMSAHGHPVVWHLRWESLILAFFESTLGLSIWGHQIIAICRMAGFNALRNTYRPLSSTTIAEFFNRFYYYFKELLVDFFFFPAFLRYWKGHRRLRVVFATFAAVLFGNAFFHFTRDWQIIRDVGFMKALVNYEASLLYCFILAAALSISQLRKRGARPAGFVRGRLLPAATVCLFYCLLNVFVTDERSYSLTVYLRYLASLFFLEV